MVSHLQLGTIWKVCCEVILWCSAQIIQNMKARGWSHYSCDSPLYSHTAAIIQNLWLSSERECNHGWKSISGTSGKIKTLAQCQQGQGLVQEKRRDFSHHRFGFPFAKGNQPAAPESLPLVKSQILILLGAASDVEPGSIQLVLGVT